MTTPEHWEISSLEGSASRRRRESIVKRTAFSAASVSVLVSTLIVYALVFEAWAFMREVDWATTWGQLGWFPRRNIFDLPTIIVSSLTVTVIAMGVATPLGLGAAIFLSEYASPRLRTVLKPVLEVLASIPSVVLGYFALRFIAPNVIASLFASAAPANLAAAGIGVGLLTVPLMASISEDALAAVPRSLREASSGLGARKVTTTTRVVLPAALSGLTAAFIVAVSRAIGETMVVFIAGGAADSAIRSFNPLDPGLTMTASMASVASGTDNVAGEGPAFQSLFFVGLLLFLITLLLNILADRFVRRFRQEY
ncbi:MAG: phosphate ABC transporter permease subunit PstC [Actinomycetia bacterium]|nr:phosphate ABC transporter permease subunit PstC [Actinomycetes bacterium]MCP5032331.1 phosphate ABC transporter permease subunit PstC [Actinomycetes bacterium]